MIGNLLETCMLICFGLSWPVAAVKQLRAKTAKGASVFFYFIIMAGYLCGIAAKIANANVTYVIAIYGLNFLMVGFNVLLYFRNRAFDRGRDLSAKMESL